MTETVEATLCGVKLVFKAPDQEAFDRFTDKHIRNQKAAGDKELLLLTRLEPSQDELLAILEKKPAAISKLADAVDDIAPGLNVKVETGEEYVEALGVKFRFPDLTAWESVQAEIGAGKRSWSKVARSHLIGWCSEGNADQFFKENPAALGRVFGAIADAVGADVEIEVKKG